MVKKRGRPRSYKIKNHLKAETLYRFIDNSSFFSNPVRIDNRSIMNVPFILDNKELDSLFLKQAEERDLMNLKGHRSLGGMRASIYNAMPIEGAHDLIEFMKEFEAKNG